MNILLKTLRVLAVGFGPFKYKLAAAALDERGKVIAYGTNIRKTHPLQAHHAKSTNQPDKVFLHAEIAALVKCRSQPHSLFVIRVRGNGSLGMAKPCPICMSAILEAGVRTIIYSNSIGGIVEEQVCI